MGRGFNLPSTPTEAIVRSIQNPISPPVGAVVGKLARYGLVGGAGLLGGAMLLGGGQEQQQEASADQASAQNLDFAQRMQQDLLTRIANRTSQGADTAGSVTIGGSAGGANILSPTSTNLSTTSNTTSNTSTTYNIQAPTTTTIQGIAQDQSAEQKSDSSGIIMIIAAAIVGAVILFKK